MGGLFYLRCQKCGYSFKACYGYDEKENESDLREIIEFKQRLEKGEGPLDFQQIYNAMKAMVDAKEEKDDTDLINTINESRSIEEVAESSVILKSPRVSISIQPYECEECKQFFNHKRISISTRRGDFIEHYVNCPSCNNPYAFPIEESEIRPKRIDGDYDYLCETWCPKCNGSLEVKEWVMS